MAAGFRWAGSALAIVGEDLMVSEDFVCNSLGTISISFLD
jgi:hypothetical protein